MTGPQVPSIFKRKDGETTKFEMQLPPNPFEKEAPVASSKAKGEQPDAIAGSAGNISIHRYPSDLEQEHLPHSLMFFVRIRKSDLSSAEKGLNDEAFSKVDTEYGFEGNNNNRPLSNVDDSRVLATAFGGVGGARIGASGGKVVDETFGGTGILVPPLTVAGAAVGLAAGSEIGKSVAKDRTYSMLKDVISLYVNGPPNVSYQASWAEQDLGLVGFVPEVLGNTAQKLSENGFVDTISKLLSDIGGVAQSAMLKALDKSNDVFGNAGAAIKSSTATTSNPFKAQLFNSMGFRKFSFQYTFLPKDKSEYNECREIIKIFKTYMHPNFGINKAILHYPAEWNIVHCYKGKRNDELFRMSNCALTNMKVTYGGGTDFITFAKLPGAPVEMNMSLEFTELELLTQARIQQGF